MGKSATIPDARLSKQIATNDDAAAKQEEVEEQIEGDYMEMEARENGTGGPAPMMRTNEEMETADDAVASREENEEQAEEHRIDKVALEDTISAPSAEYIRSECVHD